MDERGAMEALLAGREELVRRQADDPWLLWEPTPRQRPFVEAVLGSKCYENWMVCANRVGKSDAAAYCGASLARFGPDGPSGVFRPTKGFVISPTGGSSKTIVQPKMFNNGLASAEAHPPFIPEREVADFNQNDQRLLMKNGSIVEFKSAEQKTISLAGPGLDWVLIDEECPKALYDELTIRVKAGARLRVFGACTLLPPEGQVGGVSWMFDHFIKPWQRAGGSESTFPPEWSGQYRLYGASIYDNPHLSSEEIARLEARYPVGSAERQIRLEGLWLPGLQGSRAYTSFDMRVHVRPQSDWPERRPLCWTWDFNVEPMVSLVGWRDGSIFRIKRELILDSDASIDQMVQYFHEVVPLHHGEVWVYGDATGRARHVQTGRSEFQMILNLMRTYGSPVRLKVPEANPLVPDRINALNRAFRDETGVHHVEIDPSCVELIADLEGVLRDNRGRIKKSRDRKDPYFRRTHTSDALGYWVVYEEPVRRMGIGERVMRTIRNPGYAFRQPNSA